MICTFKKKLAKVLCGVLVFTQLGTMQAFARPDWPSDTGIEAEAGAVMDVDTGTMLFGQPCGILSGEYHKDPHSPRGPGTCGPH